MSSDVVEYSAARTVGEESGAKKVGSAVRGKLAVLAPSFAALAALLIHVTCPSRQSAVPTRLYPILLEGLLVAALLLALVQWAWKRSRPWALNYAPLFAGVIVLLCAWDLLTLKLAWMPLPYFPGPDMVLQGMLDDRAMLFDSTYHSLFPRLAEGRNPVVI